MPAIKLIFGGVEMDLLMAQLEHDSIAPTLDLSDDDILRNLSDKCVRSVNGMCKSNHTKIGGGGKGSRVVCLEVC